MASKHMGLLQEFLALPIHREALGLEQGDLSEPYFCYPVGAEVIGFEGCILYCFLPEYGDMVFASNPESCAEECVYPLARSFADFLRLVLSCGSVNPVEQIVWMDRAQFDEHLTQTLAELSDEARAALDVIARELRLCPMEDPYGYVKAVQQDFDRSRIRYSDEYYDVLGLEPPDGWSDCYERKPLVQMESVEIQFQG